MALDEYLAFEAQAQTKHEFWNGYVLAMAGASVPHNRVTSNLVTAFNLRFQDRDCHAIAADLRVEVGTRYVYPDVVVECGAPDLTETDPPSLRNPALLVEVTSPSTADRDRGEKLHAYAQLASLHEYWIVDTDRAAVTQYLRRGEEWVMQAILGVEATVRSTHFELDIPLGEIYRRVLLETER